MGYQKHRRDYSLLGTSVMFEAFRSQKTREFFAYSPRPMFVLVENGALYHFTSEEDDGDRVRGWIKRFGKTSDLEGQKISHDKILNEYRSFLKAEYGDPFNALKKLHFYFEELLPVILVAIEAPGHPTDVDSSVLGLCMKIRKENEDVYKVGFDYQGRLLREMEKELGIANKDLDFLTADEYKSFCQSKKLSGDLDRRRKFVLVKHPSQGPIEVFYNQECLKKFGLNEEMEILQPQEIKGQPAYQGKIVGRVRVINFVEEAHDLLEGEILVASMTDPRYVSVMKRAAAIVTDEGGITCHAAIVSREMNKPCIIGTKIATKVLHDGDEVEVDATKGIVKIIKRTS